MTTNCFRLKIEVDFESCVSTNAVLYSDIFFVLFCFCLCVFMYV